MRIVIAVAMTVLLAGGSARASKEMDQLQTDVKDLQKQLAVLQQSIKEVTLQMVNIQARLQEQLSTMQKGTADLALKVDDLAQRTTVVGEKMQGVTGQLDSISQQLARPMPMAADPFAMSSGGIPPAGGTPLPGATGGATSTIPTAGTAPMTSTLPPPEQIYNTAYTDYIKGNFDLAIAGFRQYVTNYPGTQLSDNAQYWIGECFYSQKRYDQAVVEFDKAIQSFPKGDKVPSALLKKGYALLELYRTTDAVDVLQSLIDGHPVSDEARIAKQRLQDLGLRPR